MIQKPSDGAFTVTSDLDDVSVQISVGSRWHEFDVVVGSIGWLLCWVDYHLMGPLVDVAGGVSWLEPIDWLFSLSLQLPFSFFILSLALCVLTCLLKWSDRMKRLLQTGHANRFSPVCVRRCRCSSSDRVNLLPQKSQLQTNGLSPVCHRRCALR